MVMIRLALGIENVVVESATNERPCEAVIAEVGIGPLRSMLVQADHEVVVHDAIDPWAPLMSCGSPRAPGR